MKTLIHPLCISVLSCALVAVRGNAQSEIGIPAGFHVIEGDHLRLISDMPDQAELSQLVQCFEVAMDHWGNLLDVPRQEAAGWKCTAYLMLDRKRFEQSGLLPDSLPLFPYGFQYGDRIWVTEQPSAYYRRHLLLHEGTHWFMWRKYGGMGPPWLMEGMAEWLATHRWEASEQRLEMGIIPRDKEEVPYWGRIKIIQDQLAEGLAPSLEDILRYDGTAHQRVDAYAWSWAAVLFLSQHPDSRGAFRQMLGGSLKPDATNTRAFFRRLHARWPALRTAWRLWISDLDYGADASRMLLQLPDCKPLRLPATVTIDVSQGWQASGLCLPPGARIRLTAEGRFTVANEPRPWVCTADGVTLEYYRGRPLGQLIAAIVAPQAQESPHTEPVSTIAVGAGTVLPSANGGQLILRINEATGSLHDNRGTITVRINAVDR
ncbi:MAG: hypothetical protein D6753_17690 [Planctomycetota bacterium]|nr:MAG: hypothetical protein D6753_17690 [Planctomycetota bacterium]